MTRPEPPESQWVLPDPSAADPGEEILGVGADLEPGTLLAAYRSGVFPMPVERGGPIGWWSPDPRGVLPLDGLRVTASLRKSMRRFVTTVDTDFRAVIERCADPNRPHGWIDGPVIEAYEELHRLGFAHSVETRTTAGELVGGLYGVEIDGLFAGESMFSLQRDASKVALVHLVDVLNSAGDVERRLLDVQWRTDHLESLGVIEISRPLYLERLVATRGLEPAFPLPTDC
jgi:leucyl/phenylalanyl-tRNA--protein transferase